MRTKTVLEKKTKSNSKDEKNKNPMIKETVLEKRRIQIQKRQKLKIQ